MLPEIQSTALELPFALEMLGVVVGSMCGALAACARKLDIVGAAALAMVCGLGGGLIRDVIMQVGTVYLVDSAYGIPVSVAVGIVVFLFHSPFEKRTAAVEWLDIVAVALFAVAGADKALVWGKSLHVALLMGVLTGNGGGLLRDIVLGDVPQLFQKGNWYAICALFGSAAYIAAVEVGCDKGAAGTTAVVLIVALRRAALRYNLQSVADVDLTPHVKRGIERAQRGTYADQARRRRQGQGR